MIHNGWCVILNIQLVRNIDVILNVQLVRNIDVILNIQLYTNNENVNYLNEFAKFLLTQIYLFIIINSIIIIVSKLLLLSKTHNTHTTRCGPNAQKCHIVNQLYQVNWNIII